MLGDKEEHFEGKGTDLGALQAHLEEYLKSNGFTVQTSAPSDQGAVVQAKRVAFCERLLTPTGRLPSPSREPRLTLR